MPISVYDSNTNESLQFVTASSFDLGNGGLSSIPPNLRTPSLNPGFVFSTVSHASSRFGSYNFVFVELLRTHYNVVLNSLFHTTLVLYFLFVILLSLFTVNTSEG